MRKYLFRVFLIFLKCCRKNSSFRNLGLIKIKTYRPTDFPSPQDNTFFSYWKQIFCLPFLRQNQHLFVQIQQHKWYSKKRNMFKINNRNTKRRSGIYIIDRGMLMADRILYCLDLNLCISSRIQEPCHNYNEALCNNSLQQ